MGESMSFAPLVDKPAFSNCFIVGIRPVTPSFSINALMFFVNSLTLWWFMLKGWWLALLSSLAEVTWRGKEHECLEKNLPR
jgi:hypothetical protein